MAANTTDNFMEVAPEADVTYMTGAGKALGASSFTVNSAAGWPSATGFIVAIRNVDNSGNYLNDGSYTEWAATVAGSTVSLGSSPSPVLGSDQVYAAGTTTQVYLPVSSTRENRLVQTLLLQHTQSGSHTGLTTDSFSASGNATIGGTLSVSDNLTLGEALVGSVQTVTTGATITPTTTTNFYSVSALASAATIAAPSGTPVDGQILTIRIRDNGTAQALTWNAIYHPLQYITLPTATYYSNYVSCRYNAATAAWDVLSALQG